MLRHTPAEDRALLDLIDELSDALDVLLDGLDAALETEPEPPWRARFYESADVIYKALNYLYALRWERLEAVA